MTRSKDHPAVRSETERAYDDGYADATVQIEDARQAARFFARIHRAKHNDRDFLSFPGVTWRKRENFLDYILRVYDAFAADHPFKSKRKQCSPKK